MVLHHMTVFTEAIILDMEQSILDPPMPLHQGERPFGVYVRQAGHRVLLTFHPLAPFEVLDPLADLNHIGQTRECAVSSQLR